MNDIAGPVLAVVGTAGLLPIAVLLARDAQRAVHWLTSNPMKPERMARSPIGVNEMPQPSIKITSFYKDLILPATPANMTLVNTLLAADAVTHQWDDTYTKGFLVRENQNPIKIEVGLFDVLDAVPVSQAVIEPLTVAAE